MVRSGLDHVFKIVCSVVTSYFFTFQHRGHFNDEF